MSNNIFFILTKPLTGPPVWLFERGELHVRVQPQSIIQIRRATLWLPNDVEIRKAPHTIEFPITVKQVFLKSIPQVLKHSPESPRIARVQVCPVWVQSDIPSVFLVPAGVLHTRQKFVRGNRKHL